MGSAATGAAFLGAAAGDDALAVGFGAVIDGNGGDTTDDDDDTPILHILSINKSSRIVQTRHTFAWCWFVRWFIISKITDYRIFDPNHFVCSIRN